MLFEHWKLTYGHYSDDCSDFRVAFEPTAANPDGSGCSFARAMACRHLVHAGQVHDEILARFATVSGEGVSQVPSQIELSSAVLIACSLVLRLLS